MLIFPCSDMAFFNFFKKKKQVKEVNYESLVHVVEEKKKRAVMEEKYLLKIIRADIEKLANNLSDGIATLKDISLDEKKEDKRIKLIVMENLRSYIFGVERLRKDLIKIEKNGLSALIDEITFVLNDFNKKTSKHYERATILIGKEMVSTRESIITFSNNFRREESRNNELISRLRDIANIEDKIGEIGEFKKEISGNKNKQVQLRDKSEVLDKKVADIKNKISKIKKSEEYLAKINLNLKRQEDIHNIELEKRKVSGMVDYKLLAKEFHGDMKKMELIKELKKSPREVFLGDNSKKLAKLLEGSEINIEPILKRIDDILRREIEIKSRDEIEDETKVLDAKIKDNEDKIEVLKGDSDRIAKNNARLMEMIEGNMEELGEYVLKINVRLVD